MSGRTKVIIVLILSGAVWMGVLLRLGMWNATLKPMDGILSHTFNGWSEYPVSRHLFLGQYNADDFANGRAYVSGTYPFIFFNFAVVAPLHFIFGVPYNVAHNVLPYLYVFCLIAFLVLTTWKNLIAISERRTFFLWLLIFIAVGITMTDPLPWTATFNANRENIFIMVAGVFCYLSTFVFRDEVPKLPLLLVGIFLATWAPIYTPAWILGTLFFQRTLKPPRRWFIETAAVTAWAAFNILLPVIVCRLAGIQTAGSGLLFRSGLDGSTRYMTSIFQAMTMPVDPRHWPTGWYLLVAMALTISFAYIFRTTKHRPVKQAIFLIIPYAWTAIFFPQMTSIHPYLTDILLFVPITFLLSFWCLQQEFWGKLNGSSYVVVLMAAGLVLMSNLLAIAQAPKYEFIERDIMPVASVLVFGSIVAYVIAKMTARFRSKTST